MVKKTWNGGKYTKGWFLLKAGPVANQLCTGYLDHIQCVFYHLLRIRRNLRSSEPTPNTALDTDFRITPVKCGFNTVRLHLSKTGISLVLTLGASVGLIIFAVLIRKFGKLWKVVRDCLKNWPREFPWVIRLSLGGYVLRESPMTLGNSLGQIFPDNPYGLSTVCTRLKSPGL